MKSLTINSRFLSRMGKEMSKNPNGVQITRYGLRITCGSCEYEDHYNVYNAETNEHLASFTHNHGTDNSFFIWHRSTALKIGLVGCKLKTY